VSDIIHTVLNVLEKEFMPKYLGYDHLSKEEFINKHSSKFSTKLLEVTSDSSATVILDGTYLYIQKSSNYEIQKQTYSLHKFRNLVKPMMIISTTGYILAVEGLYFADGGNNYSNILKAMLIEKGFDSFFWEGDNILLDRGFRDCIADIEDREYNVYMPSLLNTTSKQFTTADGNNSPKVTMIRWLVEAVNGRIKNKFKFFEATIPITYLLILGTLLKIACSLSNAFFPPLFTESELHMDIAQLTLDKLNQENRLQAQIVSLGLENKRIIWKKATNEDLQDFPVLGSADMKMLTLGVYQTSLAAGYTSLHLNDSSSYEIFLHKENPTLLRAKIESRYTQGKAHQLWISYEAHGTDFKSVTGHYCTCKAGSRVVGCCSHIASVIWYFGCARHSNNLTLPSKSLAMAIKDAREIIR